MKNLLPIRSHFSWSQYQCFKNNPGEYVRRYFYGEDGYTNAGMDFGKRLADALECGQPTGDPQIDYALLFLPEYPEREKTLKVNVGELTLLAKMDGYDPARKCIGEYKSGTSGWTPGKVAKHGQLTFYSLVHYLHFKEMPKEMYLHWYNQETLEIQTFPAERTVAQCLILLSDLKKTWGEIQQLYVNLQSQQGATETGAISSV